MQIFAQTHLDLFIKCRPLTIWVTAEVVELSQMKTWKPFLLDQRAGFLRLDHIRQAEYDVYLKLFWGITTSEVRLGSFECLWYRHVLNLRNKNQKDALFYSQFISIINLYMFRAGLLLIITQHKCTTHTNCYIYRKVPPDHKVSNMYRHTVGTQLYYRRFKTST